VFCVNDEYLSDQNVSFDYLMCTSNEYFYIALQFSFAESRCELCQDQYFSRFDRLEFNVIVGKAHPSRISSNRPIINKAVYIEIKETSDVV
jgi:hypothetical protein